MLNTSTKETPTKNICASYLTALICSITTIVVLIICLVITILYYQEKIQNKSKNTYVLTFHKHPTISTPTTEAQSNESKIEVEEFIFDKSPSEINDLNIEEKKNEEIEKTVSEDRSSFGNEHTNNEPVKEKEVKEKDDSGRNDKFFFQVAEMFSK